MVDTETISIVVAAVSIVTGVMYYAIELRHQNRTRDTDLVTSLFAIQNSREFQQAYGRVMSLDFTDYNDFVNKNGARAKYFLQSR